MKTPLLKDGDLVPQRRAFVEITGTAKVQQDLRCALLEPLGNDRFHPGWGSTLETFISEIADETTRLDVRAEVNRVLTNYAAVQRDKIEADINGSADTRFTTSEVLDQVKGLDVTVMQDSVRVSITIQTISGETVLVSEAVV